MNIQFTIIFFLYYNLFDPEKMYTKEESGLIQNDNE